MGREFAATIIRTYWGLSWVLGSCMEYRCCALRVKRTIVKRASCPTRGLSSHILGIPMIVGLRVHNLFLCLSILQTWVHLCKAYISLTLSGQPTEKVTCTSSSTLSTNWRAIVVSSPLNEGCSRDHNVAIFWMLRPFAVDIQRLKRCDRQGRRIWTRPNLSSYREVLI